MKISKIKINGMRNPVGFSFDSVRCAWLVTDTTAKKTVYVKIEVAKDDKFENVLFTKEGSELNSACEVLDIELKPRTRYFVRVAVTGDNKEQAQGTAFLRLLRWRNPGEAGGSSRRRRIKFILYLKKSLS